MSRIKGMAINKLDRLITWIIQKKRLILLYKIVYYFWRFFKTYNNLRMLANFLENLVSLEINRKRFHFFFWLFVYDMLLIVYNAV